MKHQHSPAISLREIFTVFIKIGFQSIGGGYAMLSVMEHLMVNEKQWITHDDFLKAIAVGQSAPGVMICNVGGFIAYRLGGVRAFALAMFGLITPSFLAVLLFGVFYQGSRQFPWLEKFFRGVGPAVVGALAGLVLKTAQRTLKNVVYFLIAFASFGAMYWFSIHPAWIILCAGLAAALFTHYQHRPDPLGPGTLGPGPHKPGAEK
jgi:chromate transporter